MVRRPLELGYSQGIFWCVAMYKRTEREKRHGEMSSGVVCSLWPWYETVA